jgi:DMSO/TMAO reductase YedYZ molybdopterin-dependent catalytic subunit
MYWLWFYSWRHTNFYSPKRSCMKYLWVIALLLTTSVHAQNANLSISITGRVKTGKTLSLETLQKFPLHSIDSLQVYNHQMVPKSKPRNIKGVLLKEVLQEVEFDAESPTVLSQYYVICTAADNYEVVFSWNELFNSATGDNALIILEKNGIPAVQDKDGLVLVTPTDRATGRRYVKELNKITIQRVN